MPCSLSPHSLLRFALCSCHAEYTKSDKVTAAITPVISIHTSIKSPDLSDTNVWWNSSVHAYTCIHKRDEDTVEHGSRHDR